MRFSLKVGDTAPALTVTVAYSDGSPVDLTGATATFAVRDATGIVVIPETAATVGTDTLSYAWQAGDTATAGFYRAEFTVTLLDTGISTFPSQYYVDVIILPSFGDQPTPSLPLIFNSTWAFDGSQEFDGVKN